MKKMKPIKPIVVVIKSERADENGNPDKSGKFIKRITRTVCTFRKRKKDVK